MDLALPGLAHLHVLVDAAGAIRSAHATMSGGACAPVEDGGALLDALVREAMRVCPGPGGGRVADDRVGLWRVERYDTAQGAALVLVRTPSVTDRLEDLGLPEAVCRMLEELGGPARRGLVLVLGDMNAGKSTLAATLLKRWLVRHGGIAFAWADPPEHDLDGPVGSGCCISVNIAAEQYGDAVVAARRSRARYFYFGEPRLDPAILAVVQASLSGPVCLSTAHGAGLIPGLIAFSAAAARVDSRAYEQLASGLAAAFHVRVESGVRRSRLVVTEHLVLGQGHGDTGRSHIRAGNLGQLGNLIRPLRAA